MKIDKGQHQAIITRLDKIQYLLQALVILQAEDVGLTKEGARGIAEMGSNKASAIWKQVKAAKRTR